jgi:anti-anti-sigma factor
MQIHSEKRGKYLMVTVAGRLDAAWADYFTDTFLSFIRNGEHSLLVDSSGITFLSSAGIRALVKVSRELRIVQGSLQLAGSNEFVSKTLETTGFGNLLLTHFPDDALPGQPTREAMKAPDDIYLLDSAGVLSLTVLAAWHSWGSLNAEAIQRLKLHPNSYALGIGSPAPDLAEAEGGYGEFIAVCGHLALLPPGEKSRPDYLVPEKDFLPEICALQALFAEGSMKTLMRFMPDENFARYGVSKLADMALQMADSELAAFVCIAETDGITGAYLIDSPDQPHLRESGNPADLKGVLAYCGEKVFAGELALIFGIVARGEAASGNLLLKPLPANPSLHAHMHVVVFPYQPIPNGKIDLHTQVEKLFGGPPPRAIMHLIDDDRLVAGLGETTLVRGALWIAPVKIKEVIL